MMFELKYVGKLDSKSLTMTCQVSASFSRFPEIASDDEGWGEKNVTDHILPVACVRLSTMHANNYELLTGCDEFDACLPDRIHPSLPEMDIKGNGKCFI
jgi:hypothetical protein